MADLIKAARETLEERANRSFNSQTWRLRLNQWYPVIEVPRPPLASVTEIKYLDADSNWQTVDPSVYVVDTDSYPALIYLADGQSWPTKNAQLRSVEINFVAGDDAGIELQAQQFVRLMVANWYENRESVSTETGRGQAVILPQNAEMLLQQLRVGWYP